MYLATVIIFSVVFYAVFRWRRRRMYALASKVPAASGQLPLIGHSLNFLGSTQDIMSTLKAKCYDAMKNDHGMTKFWLGHKLYFLSVDALDIEYILKVCLEKDDSIRFVRDVIGDGLAMAPKKAWKKRRKSINPAFSIKNMEPFMEVFIKQSQILVEQLAKHAGKGTFNAWSYIAAYNLDNVGENAIGYNFSAQTSPNLPIIEALDTVIKVMAQRFFQPWIHPDWMFRLSPPFKKYDKSKKYIHGLVDKIVIKFEDEEQHKDPEPEPDVGEVGYDGSRPQRLVTLLESFKTGSLKYGGYTLVEMREEVLAMSAAALDTSSLTMCFVLLMMGRHPEIQEKVQQELFDIWGTSDRPLVKEDLPKLVYLERVIRETLRLYPVGAITSRKVEQDLHLPSGVILPEGSSVITGFWGMHRHPKYWGDDPNEFDPDRFSPERYNPEPCAYMPFSSGPRICIGYNYALWSMKTALSTILRRFSVKVTGDNLMWPTIPVEINVTMKASYGYDLQLIERFPKNNNNK